MKRAKAFLSTFLLALFVYLSLTLAAGMPEYSMAPEEPWSQIIWSFEEFVLGISVSLIVASLVDHILCRTEDFRMMNPVRWGIILVYSIPLFIEMAKANLDVAYRIITGKIEPAIVKIEPDLESDLGLTFLANSITLTPGTLTVDIDDKKSEMYIHWIKIGEDPTENIAGRFVKWIRRFAE
ncbi:MAG: Na+/H+ antiporter subunit E [Candidatus Thermoplasmatota archaeon]|nr:Na+/H+ antiporter subunit E [Candidatus Thermoplasmatota archaeon]MBS3789358.1 Na+/H+ antiporter subunit E [Candidatus Thermoplasmatota archaeon]